jgi:hypothetical protein
MGTKFEDIVQEGINTYLLEKSIEQSSVNTKQLGKALTEFYIQEIGQYLYNIYDNDFYIFQSQYKVSKSSVSSDEISGFFNIHKRFMDRIFLKNTLIRL